MSKGTYYYRKANGLCTDCGKEIEPERKGKTTCEACKEKNTKEAQETREFRRLLGLCPRCGKNKLIGDEKNCPECRAINDKYVQRNMDLKLKSDYESRKRNRKKDRENGICTSCRKRKADVGYAMCDVCKKKRREYMKSYSLRKRGTDKSLHIIWLENGLCSNCGKETYKDYNVCEECYGKILKVVDSESSKRAREEVKKRESRRYIEYQEMIREK